VSPGSALRALLFGALFAAAVVCVLPEAAVAQATVAMRERIYDKLSKAQAAAEAKNYAEATQLLADVEKVKDLSPYELAQLYTTFGYLHFLQEKYDEAIQAYEKVLAQKDLPEALQTATLYAVSQLAFQQESYDKALEYLNRWLALAKSPGPEPFVLRAQAEYQLGRYQDGVASVDRALQIAAERGEDPRENWYLLLRVLHGELDQPQKALEVLEILVSRFPKKDYWLQLAAIYGEIGDEVRTLAAYRLAYEQGFLTTNAEIVLLAQLLLQGEIPYAAATTLAKGMDDGIVEPTADNHRLLSQAWTLAREDQRAIESLRAAAALTNDGEVDARLAQSYMSLDEWEKAVEAARESIRKGVEDAFEVRLMEGTALYELGRFDDAKAAFGKAAQSAEGQPAASQWIAYIEREQARLAELNRSLN